jgi:hypothetical protein
MRLYEGGEEWKNQESVAGMGGNGRQFFLSASGTMSETQANLMQNMLLGMQEAQKTTQTVSFKVYV